MKDAWSSGCNVLVASMMVGKGNVSGGGGGFGAESDGES